MIQGGRYSLPAEAIERPEQHQVELALVSVDEHLLELSAPRSAAGLVTDVFAGDGPLLLPAVLAELNQLILGVLPTVFRGHAGVKSNFLDRDGGGTSHGEASVP